MGTRARVTEGRWPLGPQTKARPDFYSLVLGSPLHVPRWGGQTPAPCREGTRTSAPTNRILVVSETSKRLEVLLFSPVSSPPPQLCFICRRLAQPRAGRDGSRGDAALRQGQQQAQGPQHPLAAGPAPGPGLPSAHRVSTGSWDPGHLGQPFSGGSGWAGAGAG